MKKWIVELDFGSVPDSPGLREQCEEYRMRDIEVLHHDDDLLQLRLECSALDIHDAAQVAFTMVKAAGTRVQLSAPDGIGCRRSSAREVIPELLGLSEISELLGVTRQRVTQLAKLPGFPLPVTRLAMGPVFSARAVRRFQAEWQRKVGRPRLDAYSRKLAKFSTTDWRTATDQSPAD